MAYGGTVFHGGPGCQSRWKVCDIALTLVPQTLPQHNRQVPVFKNLRFVVYANTLHRVWAEGCLARTTKTPVQVQCHKGRERELSP